ncbi:hypothetical protein ABZX85_47610 [Streptomyces sp. NPDC004539]|uniref:hypothetical protein n=1 Tax=Streptomyces sp. NPDC004539 TaxID=3154280 RepID=UPI0033B3ADFE
MTEDDFWLGHLHGYGFDDTTGEVWLDSMIDEPGPHFKWTVFVRLKRDAQVDLAVFLLTQILSEPDTKEQNDDA